MFQAQTYPEASMKSKKKKKWRSLENRSWAAVAQMKEFSNMF
jgi:hypothetical protein